MKTHFADEESYMLSIAYPRLNEHKKIHNYITQSMIELINKIHNVNDMKEQLGVIAKKWLLEHILQEDMKIEAWRKKSCVSIAPQIIKEDEKFLYSCSCKKRFLTYELHSKIQSGSKFVCKNCGEVIVFLSKV